MDTIAKQVAAKFRAVAGWSYTKNKRAIPRILAEGGHRSQDFTIEEKGSVLVVTVKGGPGQADDVAMLLRESPDINARKVDRMGTHKVVIRH